MGSEEFQDTTRLTSAQRDELLQLLDLKAANTTVKHESLRKQARFEYRAADVPVTVTHPSGGVARFLVTTRNLSCGGLSFIHGGFLHQDSHCRVTLTNANGKETVVLGKVASCRHLAKRLHEIGLAFYERIEIGDFCDPSDAPSTPADSVATLVPTIDSLVLCIGSDAAERSTLVKWLHAAEADAEPADCLGAGLDLLKKLPFDLVICDMNLAEAVAGDAVREIRGAGFTGEVVGVLDSADASGPRRASCNAGLERPLTAERFYAVVSALVDARPEKPKEAAPLYSTLDRNAGSAALLRTYIDECRQSARRLRTAVEEEDRDRVLTVAKHLQSTAAGYGFAPLVEASQRVVAAVSASNTLNSAARRIRLLESMCQRVTSEAPRKAA